MAISMFLRWVNILKFLRFNSKFSNLIMMIGNVISDLKYIFNL
jgi:hypothetical protein